MAHLKTWSLSITILIFMIISLLPFIDSLSYTYQEEAFERALYAFGIAKTLNGIISLLQGTEIQGSLIFAGATFSVGEILDPLNDMIERFSWLMLVSTIALGLEKLLISFGATQAIKIVIFTSGSLLLFSLWFPISFSFVKKFLWRFFLVVLILRFCMPVFELTNSIIHNHFTATLYTNSTQILTREVEILESRKNHPPKDLDFYHKLSNKIESISKEMINIMVVFTFHTILLPLLFLWGSMRSVGTIAFGRPHIMQG